MRDTDHPTTETAPSGQSKRYVEQLILLYDVPIFKPDLSQQRIWKAFLRHATEFREVDWEASRRLAKRHRSKPKKCFDNCRHIHIRHPEYRYFEGFANSVLPLEHAWLVREDGVVIDPTWAIAPWELPGSRDADYFGLHVELKDLMVGNLWKPHWVDPLLQTMETESL